MEKATITLAADADGIARAAALLREGRQVAFPTETVYGLGADARDDRAVAGIYAAKGRPAFNPLIVHVADTDTAQQIAAFSPKARALADAFWPGPLTLVLPLRAGAGISRLVTAGLDSVALRVPAHPVARALLAAFGGPVAAPSANPSGRISPTTAAHVVAGLSGRIAAVLDGGATPVGVESTIVGFDSDAPVLLRPGGVAGEDIARVLGQPLRRPDSPAQPTSPGQLASHYAPRGRVRLEATEAHPGEVMLGFGPVDGALNLSPSADMTEAAANLFAMLHRLDEAGAEAICVAPIPRRGLGVAINDRLARAAAPRDRS
ncbi:MAG: threonylcarbamoyl-AMP synthase [Rubellimicrobium sp.]|nr:threonylcarbamoyl-AMP synthase [Rubellimicrobium sp.]